MFSTRVSPVTFTVNVFCNKFGLISHFQTPPHSERPTLEELVNAFGPEKITRLKVRLKRDQGDGDVTDDVILRGWGKTLGGLSPPAKAPLELRYQIHFPWQQGSKRGMKGWVL